jgi:hypothetical protein
MKSTAIVLFILIFAYHSHSQNITSATTGKLQVYFLKSDGTQSVMNSERLFILYDQLKMTGELILNTLATDDETLRNLLDSALFDKITFSGLIPEGQFAFQSMLNVKFNVETDLFYGDQQSRILLDFAVSNRNTSLANTFDITCTGSISLLNDLGISRDLGLDDKVSFQFFQNAQTKNY